MQIKPERQPDGRIVAMLTEASPLKIYVVVGGAVLTAFLGAWVFSSAMEASAYNTVTGADVSTWDAMWIELRVQDGPR